MNALLTGHLGYIGRHVCSLLTESNHVVHGVDIRDGGRDLCSGGAAFPDCHGRFDAVLHLAALASVSESVSRPLRYWGVNLHSTQALLSALACQGFQGRIVFASSLLAIHPESSPYAATKSACELLIEQSCRRYGWKAVILRLANVAGGGDITPGRLWVELAHSARTGEPFRLCLPSDPARAPVRDYVHVKDVARAFEAALELPVRAGLTVTIPIGTGQGTSVTDCLSLAQSVLGRPIETHCAPARSGDIAWSVADPEPAACLMGWRARYSLDDIAREALAFAAEGQPAA